MGRKYKYIKILGLTCIKEKSPRFPPDFVINRKLNRIRE